MKKEILVQEVPPLGGNITVSCKMFESRFDLEAWVEKGYTKGYLWEKDGLRLLTVMRADKKELT